MLGTGSSRSASFSSALVSQVLLDLPVGVVGVGGAAGRSNQQQEEPVFTLSPQLHAETFTSIIPRGRCPDHLQVVEGLQVRRWALKVHGPCPLPQVISNRLEF